MIDNVILAAHHAQSKRPERLLMESFFNSFDSHETKLPELGSPFKRGELGAMLHFDHAVRHFEQSRKFRNVPSASEDRPEANAFAVITYSKMQL
jgi:hypothetical protein